MQIEPWMLAAMEDYGYMDTREGQLNRVARYLASQPETEIGNEEFYRACDACGVDAGNFDREDLRRLQRKLDSL